MRVFLLCTFLFTCFQGSAQLSVSGYIGKGKDNYTEKQNAANGRGKSIIYGSDWTWKSGGEVHYQIPNRIWRFSFDFKYSTFSNFYNSTGYIEAPPFGKENTKSSYYEYYDLLAISAQFGLRKKIIKRFYFFIDIGPFYSESFNVRHNYFFEKTYRSHPEENYSLIEEGEELKIPNMGLLSDIGLEFLFTKRISIHIGMNHSLHKNILWNTSFNNNAHLETNYRVGGAYSFADQF